MRLSFLINPVSVRKLKCDIEPLIAKTFDTEKDDLAISFSESPEHLTALAKDAVERGVDIVAAVGGDGTVQRVGKELIGTQSALAIVPIGSGNGLARHFGISMNPEKALKQIAEGKKKAIDSITINGDASLNIAGVGFDGHIAHLFASSKARGFWSYLILTAKEYLRYRPQNYTLRLDGKESATCAFLISVCNASQYGNRAVIAPHAEVDDGFLDVVILKKFPLLAGPGVIYGLFRRLLQRSSYVQTFRCRKVEIFGEQLEIHIDGEPFFASERFSCIVNPLSLKLIIPA